MRRSADQKFLIVFTKPKAAAGQGYLRIDRNLWFYDAPVGRWERRTERERIGGTDSRRSDFDESRLADEYEPTDLGEEKLGVHTTRVMRLEAKAGLDVAFPVMKLWVDEASGNLLKRQEFALSGRLLRDHLHPGLEEDLQPVEEGRRLVRAGDPPLRRAREGELDADPGQVRGPEPPRGQHLHQGLAGEPEPLSGTRYAGASRASSAAPSI